jgi:hypothetical protein
MDFTSVNSRFAVQNGGKYLPQITRKPVYKNESLLHKWSLLLVTFIARLLELVITEKDSNDFSYLRNMEIFYMIKDIDKYRFPR